MNLWSKYVKKCHFAMNTGWKFNTSGTSRLTFSTGENVINLVRSEAGPGKGRSFYRKDGSE